MKNDEFHVPFIQSLIIIACVTVFSMSFAHYYIPKLYDSYQNSQEYTSLPSYNQAKAGE
jgi:ABC-type spermidine/putrescine transport system permease subunit I